MANSNDPKDHLPLQAHVLQILISLLDKELHGYSIIQDISSRTSGEMVLATHLLVPIQSSYLSLEGTDDLLETVDRIRRHVNPKLELLGVLITLHDQRTVLGRDVVARVRNVFGEKVFDTMISRSVRLEESPAYRESIFSHAPDSSGARQYAQLGEEVMQRA